MCPIRSRRRLLGAALDPYRRLFAVPGARAFTAGNLIARLPMGMFSVSAVIMIAERYGSYALAGAVPAAGLAATAVVGPLTARLVDRRGQARIAVPAAAIAALGSLALALCVHLRAPAWTLFAAYALTATTPNTGGMSRARWAHAFRGPGPGNAAALHTANSFEQAADELSFMTGPVLAALLCTTAFPEAGTVTGAVLLTAGILLFAAQRATEPPPRPRTPGDRTRSPLRRPGFPPLLAAFCCAGAVFGSMEVVTIAYADRLGRPAAAGGILALLAAGSCLAGLVYGMRHPAGAAEEAEAARVRGAAKGTEAAGTQETLRAAESAAVAATPAAPATSPTVTAAATTEAAETHGAEAAAPAPAAAPPSAAEPLFLRCVLAMAALMLLPLLAAATGRLPLLALALLLAGMATAPTMITGMSLVQSRTPAARLNEGMTLAVTALLAGIAAGSATGGWAAGSWAAGRPAVAYAVPLAAATAAALAATALTTAPRRRAA